MATPARLAPVQYFPIPQVTTHAWQGEQRRTRQYLTGNPHARYLTYWTGNQIPNPNRYIPGVLTPFMPTIMATINRTLPRAGAGAGGRTDLAGTQAALMSASQSPQLSQQLAHYLLARR